MKGAGARSRLTRAGESPQERKASVRCARLEQQSLHNIPRAATTRRKRPNFGIPHANMSEAEKDEILSCLKLAEQYASEVVDSAMARAKVQYLINQIGGCLNNFTLCEGRHERMSGSIWSDDHENESARAREEERPGCSYDVVETAMVMASLFSAPGKAEETAMDLDEANGVRPMKEPEPCYTELKRARLQEETECIEYDEAGSAKALLNSVAAEVGERAPHVEPEEGEREVITLASDAAVRRFIESFFSKWPGMILTVKQAQEIDKRARFPIVKTASDKLDEVFAVLFRRVFAEETIMLCVWPAFAGKGSSGSVQRETAAYLMARVREEFISLGKVYREESIWATARRVFKELGPDDYLAKLNMRRRQNRVQLKRKHQDDYTAKLADID